MLLTPSTSSHPSTAFPSHGAYAIILIRDVDTLCGCLICFRGIDDSLLDIRGEAVEGLLHIDVALSRNLHERYAQLIC